MTEVDPRLVAALTEQLSLWRKALAHTGSVVQVTVEAGDEVIADLGPLGRAAATVSRR